MPDCLCGPTQICVHCMIEKYESAEYDGVDDPFSDPADPPDPPPCPDCEGKGVWEVTLLTSIVEERCDTCGGSGY